MATEANITARICKNLKALGIYFEKTHGSPWTRKGRPDLMVIVPAFSQLLTAVTADKLKGVVKLCFLEVKQPGELPTLLQQHRIKELREAGAIAEVVTSWEEARKVLGL